MNDMLSVAVLPIGEFDFPSVKTEYEAILGAFERLGADLIIADPAVDETEGQRSVQGLMEQKPDLLLLVPLRGLARRRWRQPGGRARRPACCGPSRAGLRSPAAPWLSGRCANQGSRPSCCTPPRTTPPPSPGSAVSPAPPKPFHASATAASGLSEAFSPTSSRRAMIRRR